MVSCNRKDDREATMLTANDVNISPRQVNFLPAHVYTILWRTWHERAVDICINRRYEQNGVSCLYRYTNAGQPYQEQMTPISLQDRQAFIRRMLYEHNDGYGMREPSRCMLSGDMSRVRCRECAHGSHTTILNVIDVNLPPRPTSFRPANVLSA